MIQTNNSQKNINTKYWQQRVENPIIRGYFPRYKSYKEMAIAKVNRVLCGFLIFSIIVSFVSYYLVTSKEVVLNKIGNEITETKAQNFELQNELDKLKSYYNVDKTVKQKNLLQKPEQVVEVNSVKETKVVSDESVKKLSSKSKKNVDWALGF